MDNDKFNSTYNESRNGANGFIRHPFNRRFIYSDGVKELAEIGMYWLLDIVATEVVQAFEANPEVFGGLGFLHVVVNDSKADLSLVRDDGEPSVWARHIDYTDLPEGKFIFYIGKDDDLTVMHLPSEY